MSMHLIGKLVDFNNPNDFVAIIGSRKATESERKAAYHLGRTLADKGLTIVSGLAEGIDEESHAGALSSNASHCKTIAIVSTSTKEKVYPPHNQAMSDIIKEEGAMLYLFDTVAPWTKERFGPKQRRLAERSVMQAVIPSTIYVVSDNTYIEGGTRWALNYGKYLGRNIFRYDSNHNVYANPSFKEEKRLITWDMELNWKTSYEDLLLGNFKHIQTKETKYNDEVLRYM